MIGEGVARRGYLRRLRRGSVAKSPIAMGIVALVIGLTCLLLPALLITYMATR